MRIKSEIEFKTGEISYHDSVAETYDDKQRLDSPREAYVCGDFLKWLSRLNSDALVLEAGRGTGNVAVQVAQKGLRILASDISPGMIAVSRDRIERQGLIGFADFTVMDGEMMPFQDGSFDCIMIVSAFHHLMNPGQFLQEARRCLKPGGYLIIGVEPNRGQLMWNRKLASLRHSRIGVKLFPVSPGTTPELSPGDAAHQGFTRKELSATLEEAGFTVLAFHNLVYLVNVSDMIAALGRTRGISLPAFVENLFIKMDKVICKIPVINGTSRELSVLCKRE